VKNKCKNIHEGDVYIDVHTYIYIDVVARQCRPRSTAKGRRGKKCAEKNVKYSGQEMLSCTPMQYIHIYIHTHTHTRQCRACCTAKYKWKNKAKN
jgi:hypothetical protein